jgi:hypothetical protein
VRGNGNKIVTLHSGFLLEFYQRNGLNLFFSSLEQEMEYRNWDMKKRRSAGNPLTVP